MFKSLKQNRSLVIVSIAVMFMLQIIGILVTIGTYGIFTWIFILYAYVSFSSQRMLWGKAPHRIAAVLWSLGTTMLLGFVGVFAPLSYWFLISCKSQNIEKLEHNQKEKERKKKYVQTSGIIRRHGQIPFFRLPLPWLTYTLNLDSNLLTRNCWFSGKPEKGEPRDIAGKDDDLLLKQVFDWDFSNNLYCLLAGTTCFEFQSRKIGRSGDKLRHWHNLPVEFKKPLRQRLIELNQ